MATATSASARQTTLRDVANLTTEARNGASISPYGPARSTILDQPLSPEELETIDAYWRASLYVCLGMLYLQDNPLLRQPLKIEHVKPRMLGHWGSDAGQVLIYIHKEESLADVERRYPADHYVLVDDKLRILTAVKDAWGRRVTTVFVRQGKFALDPKIVAAYPPADRTVGHISDLLDQDLTELISETAQH